MPLDVPQGCQTFIHNIVQLIHIISENLPLFLNNINTNDTLACKFLYSFLFYLQE